MHPSVYIIIFLLFVVASLLYLYLTKPCQLISNYLTPLEKTRLRVALHQYDFMKYLVFAIHYSKLRRTSDGNSLSSLISSDHLSATGRRLGVRQWDELFSHLVNGTANTHANLSPDDIKRISELDKTYFADTLSLPSHYRHLHFDSQLRNWDKLKKLLN